MCALTSNSRRYFASANTTGGFVSYYDEVFGKCQSTYIIKGGSGTGKSRLMKEVAAHAERVGGSVEYFHCSFDPSSLDGIIINGKTAIIDGTSPHVYEPVLPGARESIINLGAMLNVDKLRKREKELSILLCQKKHCFSVAYSYLSTIEGLDEAKRKILKKYIIRDRISAIAKDIAQRCGMPDDRQYRIRSMSAIGKNGMVTLGDFSKEAESSIVFNDEYGIGYVLLEEIISEGKRLEKPFSVSYSPLFERRPDSLLFGENAIVLENRSNGESVPIVNKISDDDENEIVSIDNVREEMEQNAVRWFETAAEYHFEIENIYSSAMNFDKKERLTQKLINTLEI